MRSELWCNWWTLRRTRLWSVRGLHQNGTPDECDLDLNNLVWRLKATPVSPSKRGHHAMAYDSMRQVSVLFGATMATPTTKPGSGTGIPGHFGCPALRQDDELLLAYDSVRGGHRPLRRALRLLRRTWRHLGMGRKHVDIAVHHRPNAAMLACDGLRQCPRCHCVVWRICR